MAKVKKTVGETKLVLKEDVPPTPMKPGDDPFLITATRAPIRYTVHLPPDIVELLKDIAWEDRITLSSIVQDALEAHVTKLVKKRGEPYPKRRGELRRGKIT
jgi:hypothetical protein